MRSIRWYLAARVALLGTAAVAMGCGNGAGADGPVEVRAPLATRLVAVSPLEFSGVVGSEVSPGPAVRAEDQNGNPLAGVAVNFEQVMADSDFSGISIVASDVSGLARLSTWKLGKQAGKQTMTALLGSSSVTFTAAARPGPGTTLAALAGDNQTGLPGYELRLPLRVRITDSFGNPVPGSQVTLSVVTGAGTITPALASTNEDGEVHAVWKLGVSGTNALTASAPGLSLLTFSAVALPLAPATYLLQSTYQKGEVFLAADGSFTMYVGDIKGSGTYTAQGTDIRFKYAPGFWELMASEHDTYLRDQNDAQEVEVASITDGKILTFYRCYSEDCWGTSWNYARVLP